MEELISKVVETSVLGAGFFYLAYKLVELFGTSLKDIVSKLTEFGTVLQQVSCTLLKIDMRVEQMEQRIKDLEGELK